MQKQQKENPANAFRCLQPRRIGEKPERLLVDFHWLLGRFFSANGRKDFALAEFTGYRCPDEKIGTVFKKYIGEYIDTCREDVAILQRVTGQSVNELQR